jgi:hypothetical protein
MSNLFFLIPIVSRRLIRSIRLFMSGPGFLFKGAFSLDCIFSYLKAQSHWFIFLFVLRTELFLFPGRFVVSCISCINDIQVKLYNATVK